MLPPESCMSPAMQLSAVDLPQPDGPSRHMNSPRLTVSVSSSSALNALPPAPANRRVTRSSLSCLKSCFITGRLPIDVVLAEAGTQSRWLAHDHWIPAFAGHDAAVSDRCEAKGSCSRTTASLGLLRA